MPNPPRTGPPAPVNATPGGIDAGDANLHGVSEPQHPARIRAHQHRLLLAQLPPVLAHSAYREHSLKQLTGPEGHEGAGADQPHDLALKRLLPTPSSQIPLEQEAPGDVVRVPLNDHRLALPSRRGGA